ncbi:MAG: hypothetical protein PVH62_07285 [Anaerolineae bacterium]|jgi:transporter family protein
MESRYLTLIIGGFIPAVLYGLAGFLQKWSAREGGSVSVYLIGFGLATFVAGIGSRYVLSDGPSPSRSLLIAVLGGLVFAIGAGLISFSIIKFDAAISQLSPIYNMNILITVLLGLLIFSEFRDLNGMRLLAGTVFIVVGGWLVSGA